MESAADVSSYTFYVFTHFASCVCHSTVVHWNYLYAFVQKGAALKVRDVYGAAFVISELLLIILYNPFVWRRKFQT